MLIPMQPLCRVVERVAGPTFFFLQRSRHAYLGLTNFLPGCVAGVKLAPLTVVRVETPARPWKAAGNIRRLLAAGVFVQTNLVSDIQGMAQTTDAHLVNPWGLSASSSSPFWVANNNDGTSTLYTGQGAIVPLVVTIPTNTVTTPPTLGSPSGTVANTAGSGFFDVAPGKPSAFLFDTEDGNIDAWGGGTVATVEVDNPSAGYKGLTLGTDAAGDNLLYAANFAQGTIDVFDQNFNLVEGAPGGNAKASPITLAGKFTDPSLPAGYAPFNIQNIGGKLYVEYSKFDAATTEGAPGAGQGFVDVYNGDGVLLTPHHLISGGALNASPWGNRPGGQLELRRAPAATCWSATSATAASTLSIPATATSSPP